MNILYFYYVNSNLFPPSVLSDPGGLYGCHLSIVFFPPAKRNKTHIVLGKAYYGCVCCCYSALPYYHCAVPLRPEVESKGPIDRRERDPADPSSHTLYATPTQESGTATPTSGEATPMDTEPGLLKHTVLCPSLLGTRVKPPNTGYVGDM